MKNKTNGLNTKISDLKDMCNLMFLLIVVVVLINIQSVDRHNIIFVTEAQASGTSKMG